MPYFKQLLIVCVVFITGFSNAYCQTDTAGIKKYIAAAEAYQTKYPAEKLYLHFDKPYYAAGDTIWFKAYLLMAANGAPSVKSSKLYVSLLNDKNGEVQKLAVPVASGLAQGYMVLDDKTLADGGYTIRAYTNWMGNFNEDHFFHKQFYIGRPAADSWLVSSSHTIKKVANGTEVNLSLQIKDMQQRPEGYKDVEMRILSGSKPLFKSTHVTPDNGIINTTFIIPAKADTGSLSISLANIKNKAQTASFPFYSGVAQNIDVQFMPEGGSLVAGLYSRVALKVIGEDGLGVNIKGSVFNSKSEEVSVFTTTHNGMGMFALMPQAGEKYMAKIQVNDSTVISHKLPEVQASGLVLRVDNISKSDSVIIYVTGTPDMAGKHFSLIAQSRDVVYFGLPLVLNKGVYNRVISKQLFPTGIAQVMLMNELNQPLNERRFFVDHHDGLHIKPATAQSYLLRDSISIGLDVTGRDGKPVIGSFSASVTDDGQIRHDGYVDNIISRMLLTANLKGYVEQPAWYFKDDTLTTRRALDILLLTQGWTNYNTTDILKTDTGLKYIAEANNSLSGKVTGLFKKPMKNARVTILSTLSSDLFIADTQTDDNGLFTFTDLPVTDTIAYTLKIHNAKGKVPNGAIKVFEPLPMWPMAAQPLKPVPWFYKSDPTLLNYLQANKQQAEKNNKLNAGNVKGPILDEVNIKGKKASKRIGMAWATPVKQIEEKELIEARRTTLKDLLYSKLKRFRISNTYSPTIFTKIGIQRQDNYVYESILIGDVVVDGMSIRRLLGDAIPGDPTGNGFSSAAPDEFFTNVNSFFTRLSAEDVKDIQMMRTDVSYILSVTTRSGAGPTLSGSTFGSYVYRPMPLQPHKDFYRPRYTVKDVNVPDYRSTIHWEPNIITDDKGKANFSFFAGAKPGTYTLIIEGTSLDGRYGCRVEKITISEQQKSK
ncbi:hypothetical protein LJ707_13085 [Mucilaginibacter sp. UR6-1]|uniref:carboxypeptidase-like regulatory domain-containing protein n=1 Tax=Mucilaginibacter sp. UR6-1 TaxID=1435643 RepID=UPI001E3594ED|nr:carboxypeptidase-like regulatory domain-containing protein [Mucilaginibacter sp. UR6-1]MCC8409865.1 hypothetical protein [Mucilaginibacter sp. UR6-1]